MLRRLLGRVSSSEDDEEAQDDELPELELTAEELDYSKKIARREYGNKTANRVHLRGALEPFLERWILTAFRLHVLSPRTCVNENFAPMPTMCAWYAMTLTLPLFKRNDVREMLNFNANCLQELRNAIASQPALSPKVTFSFLRIIVNDDEKTVVSENLINAMKDITSTDVVLACTPQRVGRYLRSLSAGAIDGPRSLHGLTTVYAAAGLRAQWCGKAAPVSPSAFATTYSERQLHPFFKLETEAKVLSMYNCEIWEIPLQAGDTPFHICLIRPRFIGDIVSVKCPFSSLLFESWPRQVVLPTFSIDSEENLWDVWTKHVPATCLTSNNALPPFNAVWNVSRVSVSADGVGVKRLNMEPCQRLPPLFRMYWARDDINHPHTPFNASIDSPFLFIITQKGTIPLLAGCYAGHPAPMNSAYTIVAPEKIRKKGPPKPLPKLKKKLTRRQKKAQKIRRMRAKRMKKQAKLLVKKTAKTQKKMVKKACTAASQTSISLVKSSRKSSSV
ncbi:hypothetical protein Q1695_014331 [Nippostrongylus brasiliensis]|nr:hypothetical protein Q1695_014331 [Nippostrongylus brasiliensis]